VSVNKLQILILIVCVLNLILVFSLFTRVSSVENDVSTALDLSYSNQSSTYDSSDIDSVLSDQEYTVNKLDKRVDELESETDYLESQYLYLDSQLIYLQTQLW